MVLSSKVQAGSINTSVLNGVRAADANVKNSILMSVTAKKINADGALVYNIVDTSDAGITLSPGDVMVGMQLPTGEKVRMLSHLDVDGKKFWSEAVKGNKYSFEGIYKANVTADPSAIESAYLADHAAAAKQLGL